MGIKFFIVNCLGVNVSCLLTCPDPEGWTGGPDPPPPPPPPPLKNHKNIGFSSNTGHLVAFRWWADDGPLILVLGSSLPTSTKKTTTKKQTIVVKVGPPLTNLSGSAHVQ